MLAHGGGWLTAGAGPGRGWPRAGLAQGGAGSGGAGSGGVGEDEKGADLVRIVTTAHSPHLLWVHEHLQHLSDHLQAIGEPATHVAEQRREPWWR